MKHIDKFPGRMVLFYMSARHGIRVVCDSGVVRNNHARRHTPDYRRPIEDYPSFGLSISTRNNSLHQVNKNLRGVASGIVRLTEQLFLDRHTIFLPPLKHISKPRGIPVTEATMTIQNPDAKLKSAKTNGIPHVSNRPLVCASSEPSGIFALSRVQLA